MNMYYVVMATYETFLVVNHLHEMVDSEHYTQEEANERCKELNDEIE